MIHSKVLLVKYDPAMAGSIIFALERDGLVVTHSLLLVDARRQLSLQTPDLVIASWESPAHQRNTYSPT